MTYHLDQSTYEQYDQSHYIYIFYLVIKRTKKQITNNKANTK